VPDWRAGFQPNLSNDVEEWAVVAESSHLLRESSQLKPAKFNSFIIYPLKSSLSWRLPGEVAWARLKLASARHLQPKSKAALRQTRK